MADEKKKDMMKNMMLNIGVALVLIGSMATKADASAFFFTGLILLALQTFEIKSVGQKKIVMAEVLLSGALTVAAITQLAMSKSFGVHQVFLIILLLGSVLVTVESVRKMAEME